MYVLNNKSVEQLQRRRERLEFALIGTLRYSERDELEDQIEDIDAELARRRKAAESVQSSQI